MLDGWMGGEEKENVKKRQSVARLQSEIEKEKKVIEVGGSTTFFPLGKLSIRGIFHFYHFFFFFSFAILCISTTLEKRRGCKGVENGHRAKKVCRYRSPESPRPCLGPSFFDSATLASPMLRTGHPSPQTPPGPSLAEVVVCR